MKNEDLTTMLKSFADNGISHETNRLNEVLAFQDVIGRMNYNDIFESYDAMDKAEKGLFLWASCSCIDKDMFLEIVKKVVCQSIIYEEENRLNDVYTDRLADIKTRERNMTELEKINAFNVEKIKLLEMETSGLRGRCNSLTKKADSYDTIKRLLS